MQAELNFGTPGDFIESLAERTLKKHRCDLIKYIDRSSVEPILDRLISCETLDNFKVEMVRSNREAPVRGLLDVLPKCHNWLQPFLDALSYTSNNHLKALLEETYNFLKKQAFNQGHMKKSRYEFTPYEGSLGLLFLDGKTNPRFQGDDVIYVASVKKGLPAYQIGVRDQSIIKKINGKKISSWEDVLNITNSQQKIKSLTLIQPGFPNVQFIGPNLAMV